MKHEINSKCETLSCVCAKGFHEKDETCYDVIVSPERLRTEKCTNDSFCTNSTKNSMCLDDKCVCNHNYIFSKNSSVSDKKFCFVPLSKYCFLQMCLPYVKYNETCDDTIQCQKVGSGSICANNTCLCDEFHREIDDNGLTVCQKKIQYGDPCTEPNECNDYLASEHKMICVQSKCQCRQGYELFDADSKQCVKTESSKASYISFNFFIVSIFFYIHSNFILF